MIEISSFGLKNRLHVITIHGDDSYRDVYEYLKNNQVTAYYDKSNDEQISAVFFTSDSSIILTVKLMQP